MNEDIKYLFNNVNEWLKFAETKHAGLIVLNSGLAFGILSVYSSYANYIGWIWVLYGLVFIGVSIFLSLLSLYPMVIKEQTPIPIKDPNLFFNRDLSHLSVDSFKKEFLRTHQNHSFTALEDDLIRQTIFNSKVASRKYGLFKYAVMSTTLGLSIPFVSILVKALF